MSVSKLVPLCSALTDEKSQVSFHALRLPDSVHSFMHACMHVCAYSEVPVHLIVVVVVVVVACTMGQ